MNEIKKILVGTDFSTTADEAVRAAAAMAVRYDAALVIVHVQQAPNFLLPEAYLDYARHLFDESSASLAELLRAAKKKAQEAGARRVTSELLQGVPSTEIVDYASAHGCDVIVVGTHGRTGPAHAVMGSVAEKVVRSAGCPVLTIRARDRAAA